MFVAVKRLLRSYVQGGLIARAESLVARIVPRIPPGATVVDIGCGAGYVTESLRRHAFRVLPVDIDNHAIEGFWLIVADARALPLHPGRCNVALMVSMLHHCLDPDAVLAEAAASPRA